MLACLKYCIPCFGEAYHDINAETRNNITEQTLSSKNNKVDPILDYKDDIIDEHTIRKRFGLITTNQFPNLISKAIEFTNKAETNGDRELLKNTKLHLYENENFYRQISGKGKYTIVVNFENEEVVVEAIGLKY